MNNFSYIFKNFNWDETKASIYAKTSVDVEQALTASKRTLEDFKALVSPAAAPSWSKWRLSASN